MQQRALLRLLFLISLFLLAACSKPQSPPPAAQNPPVTDIPSFDAKDDTYEIAPNIIEITSAGFSPQKQTINVGDTVNFINKDTNTHWPASAMHPTHMVYPGSDIKKCGTSEQARIFDACRGLASGETFTFTFTEKGTWNYHDHLNPRMFGTVIVQ